jgi:glutathione S-transferase
MYRLHSSAGSGGFAVEAVLAELGVKYQLVHVDLAAKGHRTPAFLKLNPMGQVPVLEVPGGKVMTESAAMVLYLADRHPSPRLAPVASSPLRADFLRWLFFFSQIYGTDLRIYYPERYTSDAGGAGAVKAAAIAAMDREFAIIDRAIGSAQYMLGARYSALDPYLAMLAHWHPDVPSLLKACKNIARVAEKVKSRKAIRAIADDHKLW